MSWILYNEVKMKLKSNGAPREFSTGAIRDTQEGKSPMELLPLDLLERVAFHYGLGAEKYGTDNWRKGQPQSVVVGSIMRHLTKYRQGETDEDHLAAIIWNALSLLNVDEYMSDNPAVFDEFGRYPSRKE
jgi:hypothetical protein